MDDRWLFNIRIIQEDVNSWYYTVTQGNRGVIGRGRRNTEESARDAAESCAKKDADRLRFDKVRKVYAYQVYK